MNSKLLRSEAGEAPSGRNDIRPTLVKVVWGFNVIFFALIVFFFAYYLTTAIN